MPRKPKSLAKGRRRRNPVDGVSALALALPNPAHAPRRSAQRSGSGPYAGAAWFSAMFGKAGAARPASRTKSQESSMFGFRRKRRAKRGRRRNLANIFNRRKVGVTRTTGRWVWSGTAKPAIKRRRRYISVAKPRGGSFWRQHTRIGGLRRRNPARGLRRDSRGRFLKRGSARRANPTRRRRRFLTRRANPTRRRRRSVFGRRANPARRRRRRTYARRANPRRRFSTRGLRRSARGRFVSRKRRANPSRRRRRGGRKLSLFGRRANPVAFLTRVLPGPLKPLAAAIVPGVTGALGLGGCRFLGNKVAGALAGKLGNKWASLAGGGLSLVGVTLLTSKVKAIPPIVKNALLVGAGIDLGLRLVGALLPASQASVASILLGIDGPFGFGAPVAPPTESPATSGWGQSDVYDAGMMGTYATQYAPIQGGIGAYIPDNGQAGFGAIGAYLQETESPYDGMGMGAIGSYIEDVPALTSGVQATEAPAGWGSYVQEAPAGAW